MSLSPFWEDYQRQVMKQAKAHTAKILREFETIYGRTYHPIAERTLSEICKDAEKYSDNSVELFNLLEEVKASNLSASYKGFAEDFISEIIEKLKDKIRSGRAKRSFDQD